MSTEQKKILRHLDLITTRGEHFRNCLIFPVYNDMNTLTDLYGLSAGRQTTIPVFWQKPTRGIIGVNVPAAYPEIILCDYPLFAVHAFQYGHQNVMSIRTLDEIKPLVALLEKHDVRRVYVLSRKCAGPMEKALSKAGFETIRLKCPVRGVEKKSLSVVGTLPLKRESEDLKLTDKTDSRLCFSAKQISYRVESLSLSGIGMRVQVRAESNNIAHLDKLDLASAQSRRKYSRLCGLRLGLSASIIEDNLAGIADAIDQMQLQEAQKQTKTAKRLSKKEESAAIDILRSSDVLAAQANALKDHCNIIGEEQNRKLAVLIAASRLLNKPLGCIIRGAPSSGKSTLIQSIAKLLPIHQVLYLSRLTPQALYFLPRETLINSVMIIDEYEGISDSEYSLRTMMSSQCLSLAITLREGGRMPVTRTVEIPARLAVFVSATKQVNVENLSRFIELKMDSSEAQTLRVMQAMACPEPAPDSIPLTDICNANQLLRPCSVKIPFGRELVYRSKSVLARRQFAQLIGLVSAHAALHQFQRTCKTEDKNIVVQATREDYSAVHPLLSSIAESPEESLSPPGAELLKKLQTQDGNTVTIKQSMEAMGWSYSKCYRTLNELSQLHLVMPDRDTNGTERVYAIAPYAALDKGLQGLPMPDAK